MLLKKYKTSKATMGIWKMTESVAQLQQLYLVKPEEFVVYNKIRTDKRKREWLTVRVLLQELLGSNVEICYRDTGKPYLKNADYCISITHTDGYVGVRLASHPVALDMEYKSERVLRILNKFVSSKEQKYIDENDQISSALIIWSAKETMYKLFDFQNVDFKEHITISNIHVGHIGTTGHFRGSVNKDGFEANVKLSYEIFDDIVLVYC